MLKHVACNTCQYTPCNGCKGCAMYSERQLIPDRVFGGYTRCLCLSVGSDEACPYYKVSEYIKNTYNVSDDNGPIDMCPNCGSYDTEWIIDDDYNYSKCHACDWSSKEVTYNEEVP